MSKVRVYRINAKGDRIEMDMSLNAFNRLESQNVNPYKRVDSEASIIHQVRRLDAPVITESIKPVVEQLKEPMIEAETESITEEVNIITEEVNIIEQPREVVSYGKKTRTQGRN